jgi:hypothetical protein
VFVAAALAGVLNGRVFQIDGISRMAGVLPAFVTGVLVTWSIRWMAPGMRGALLRPAAAFLSAGSLLLGLYVSLAGRGAGFMPELQGAPAIHLMMLLAAVAGVQMGSTGITLRRLRRSRIRVTARGRRLAADDLPELRPATLHTTDLSWLRGRLGSLLQTRVGRVGARGGPWVAWVLRRLRAVSRRR